jgi:hypothetical protein
MLHFLTGCWEMVHLDFNFSRTPENNRADSIHPGKTWVDGLSV